MGTIEVPADRYYGAQTALPQPVHCLLLCASKCLESNPKTDDKTFNCWLSGRWELFSQEQTTDVAIPIFDAK